MASSEKLGLAPPPPHQIQPLNPHPQQHHLVFPQSFSPHLPQHHHHRPIAPAGDPVPKSATRELTASFLDHRHYFQQPPQAADFNRQWRGNNRSSDDDDDDDDDDEGEENNLENFAKISDSSNPNERYSTGNSSSSNNNQKPKHVSGLGLEEGSVGQSGNENNSENKSVGEVRRGGETYYTQYLNRAEGPSSLSGQKDCAVVVAESGCGFSGRKEGSYASDSGESLRSILSDPLTGTIMDDAMILPCGHSFGSGGIQQVLRMKACSTCSRPVSEDSIAPNLSLRLAVQAFKREEETQFNYTSKRRRERYDRDKGTYPDFMFTYHPREKGVQFPFAVTDRVIIKGNKRTPQRFVGREAIVTTQCLNGWYVVKTLDNAESVKLQYRSLAKVTENNNPSSKLSPIKMTPNWL